MSRSPGLSRHKRSIQRLALKNGDVVATVKPVVDHEWNLCPRCNKVVEWSVKGNRVHVKCPGCGWQLGGSS